jgi:hypothetical protein
MLKRSIHAPINEVQLAVKSEFGPPNLHAVRHAVFHKEVVLRRKVGVRDHEIRLGGSGTSVTASEGR